MEYIGSHRNVEPGKYNLKRMLERPIPESFSPSSDHDDDNSLSSDDDYPSIEEIIIPANLNDCELSKNDAGETSNPLNSSLDSTLAEIASNDIPIDPNASNNISIDETIGNNDSDNQPGNEGFGIEEIIIPANPNDCELANNETSNPLNDDRTLANKTVPNASHDTPTNQTIGNDDGDNQRHAIEETIASADMNNSGRLTSDVSASPNPLNVSESVEIGNSNVSVNDFADVGLATSVIINNSMQQNVQHVSSHINNNDEQKPEIFPIYEADHSNNDDILDALEDRVVEVLDGMEVTYKASKGFGKPLKTTSDGLVKIEVPDAISGMIPFITTVSRNLFTKLIFGIFYCSRFLNIMR